jgi:hypothetical protein
MTTGRINQVTVHLSPHKTCGPRRVLALADVPSTCLVTLQLRQQTELLKRRLTSHLIEQTLLDTLPLDQAHIQAVLIGVTF